MRVLSSRQMREADRRTIEDVGIPSIVLMENAGRQVVAAMESTFESLDSMSIAVLCGRGNNGGDGFVVARTLIERDIDVAVYLFASSADVRGDARINLDVLRNLGVDVVEIADAGAWELHGREVLAADVIVDALVGTGLSAPLSGLYETVVADVNASPRPVVAIDLPSGLSADDHAVNGPAIDASLTVTLGAPKLPLVLPPGEALSGTLVIADIGIPASVIEDVEGSWVEILTKEAMRQLVQPRAQDSHKGDYGRVLVVAGSPGKSGAAVLAGLAALRSGAGLVTIATPASQVPLVAAGATECMTLALPGRRIRVRAAGCVGTDCRVQRGRHRHRPGAGPHGRRARARACRGGAIRRAADTRRGRGGRIRGGPGPPGGTRRRRPHHHAASRRNGGADRPHDG